LIQTFEAKLNPAQIQKTSIPGMMFWLKVEKIYRDIIIA